MRGPTLLFSGGLILLGAVGVSTGVALAVDAQAEARKVEALLHQSVQAIGGIAHTFEETASASLTMGRSFEDLGRTTHGLADVARRASPLLRSSSDVVEGVPSFLKRGAPLAEEARAVADELDAFAGQAHAAGATLATTGSDLGEVRRGLEAAGRHLSALVRSLEELGAPRRVAYVTRAGGPLLALLGLVLMGLGALVHRVDALLVSLDAVREVRERPSSRPLVDPSEAPA